MGALGKAVTVTLDKEGVYVYLCTPHQTMAMIGVLVAGKPTNLGAIKAQSKMLSSRFMMNKNRLDNYLVQVK